MLPDVPSLKNDLQFIVDRYLRNAVQRRLGPFSESPRHAIHEGTRLRVIRADGSVDESELKEASAEMTFPIAEIPTMTIAERVAKLEDVAESMARQMSTHFFTTLNDGLERAGQVVDRQGKRFDVDTLFAALESIQIDFGLDGKPKNLMFVIPPALAPRVKEVAEQAEKDPAVTRRYEELMARKWSEWRDREADRKLVG